MNTSTPFTLSTERLENFSVQELLLEMTNTVLKIQSVLSTAPSLAQVIRQQFQVRMAALGCDVDLQALRVQQGVPLIDLALQAMIDQQALSLEQMGPQLFRGGCNSAHRCRCKPYSSGAWRTASPVG